MKKISLVILILVLFAGCSHNEDAIVKLPNGDVQEKTDSVTELPSFLNDRDENMKNIYAAAAQYPELLENIPCYCGCGESANHKDNFDCFVADNSADGITWDDHGTRCGVCLETAAESILMIEDGKSMKEIRDYIDEKYKEGYAKPTPTPMVEG